MTATKIGRSFGKATAGIFRVTGRAQTQVGDIEWSAVVKVLGVPEISTPGLDDDSYRELEVYRSAAFAEVCGGVRSARCYAIQVRDDVQLLWLEDLSDLCQPPWEAGQYLEAARHLGQFNAHWPKQALPEWSWLSRYGFRADITDEGRSQENFKRLPTQKDHPLMCSFVPPGAVQALLQLWDQCDELLVQAEKTPKGICHLDCHPRNLFLNSESAKDSHTIGIDWVNVGLAPLGIDIGHLLAAPLKWLDITPEESGALRNPVFEAYLSGLADAGWSGNEDQVRLTYLTRLSCEAIRQINVVSSLIGNVEMYEAVERIVGQPMANISAHWRANLEFYFASTDEAVQLTKRM